jgi:serine/threonine protein kinase
MGASAESCSAVLAAGTVSHQAMEVLHDGRITRSSDVYSFAMIMLEMITGVPVYEGFSSSQASPHCPLFRSHLSGLSPFPP